ncbi:MAG: DVU0524 family FlgM-associated protein, partial [Desulfobacterales bacterium]|nr:DVU0524 family FlgM-associated protein [Desulfobacterales bacterium]
SYQIHNVLNTFSKQLSQDRSTHEPAKDVKRQLSDQIHLSTEGKRRATIEKVAKDILTKISDYGATGQLEDDAHMQGKESDQKTVESDNKKETAFVYNVIDDLNQKTTTALSVKDTNFLIDKVEQLEQSAVEKDAAS